VTVNGPLSGLLSVTLCHVRVK